MVESGTFGNIASHAPDAAIPVQFGNDDKDCLLAEYRANVDLWKHDDDLRQKRTTTFVALNVLLYAIVSWTIKESDTIGAWTTNASAAAALLGLLICFVWYVAHLRNEQYIRFRRMQLIEIETKLGTMETFTNQYNAINDGSTISFKRSGKSFKANLLGRLSSSRVEYALPGAMTALWIMVLVFLVVKAGQPPNQKPEPPLAKRALLLDGVSR
jgi:hypothetical protein